MTWSKNASLSRILHCSLFRTTSLTVFRPNVMHSRSVCKIVTLDVMPSFSVGSWRLIRIEVKNNFWHQTVTVNKAKQSYWIVYDSSVFLPGNWTGLCAKDRRPAIQHALIRGKCHYRAADTHLLALPVYMLNFRRDCSITVVVDYTLRSRYGFQSNFGIHRVHENSTLEWLKKLYFVVA